MVLVEHAEDDAAAEEEDDEDAQVHEVVRTTRARFSGEHHRPELFIFTSVAGELNINMCHFLSICTRESYAAVTTSHPRRNCPPSLVRAVAEEGDLLASLFLLLHLRSLPEAKRAAVP